MINFKIEPEMVTEFPHYWEMCVGSCHAYTALREDYRQQLTKAHKELGFKYVRFHGIFDDDMCACVMKRDPMGNEYGIVYNFVNIDNIFDFLLRIGMKPFIELGFMPTCLASGDTTCFHYKGNITPPADYDQWKDFISAFTQHCVDRYGLEEVKQWFFEVWNEPNLPFFFTGTQEEYFRLYQSSVEAIKAVSLELKVGGPSTSINAWLPEMIQFCESHDLPLDFLSTHHYPTDDPLWRSGMEIEEFFRSGGFKENHYERGALKNMTTKASAEAGKYPLYYTEWNTSANCGDMMHDIEYSSAMVAKILADNDGLVDGYSFWTFTDIFEEMTQLKGFFHGGFGLQSVAGVAKPTYRLMQIYHELGTERCKVISQEPEATVEVLATKSEKGLQIVAYNHNVPDGEIEDQQISLQIMNMQGTNEVSAYRIDATHANATRVWQAMGEPEYPKMELIEQLHKASELVEEKMTLVEGRLNFMIPAHGVVYLVVR